MNRIFIVCMLMLLAHVAHATVFYADYDQDGIEDKMVVIDADKSIKITFLMSSINQSMHYFIKKEGDEPLFVANHSQKSNQILLDSSSFGFGAQVYTRIYEWIPSEKNWILQKVVTGKKADPNQAQFIPSLEVQRIPCCMMLGEKNIVVETEDADIKKEVDEALIRIKDIINSHNKDEQLAKIDIYEATEFAQNLNDNNVVLLNDLAFFMTKHNNIAAAIILDKIIKQYPERIVAKLNLADIYWDLDKASRAQASILYKAYYEKMKQKGLKRKVPSRVFMRMN